MSSEGRKDDKNKLMWHLLPWIAIKEVVKVLQWAAYEKPKPYGEGNWKLVDNAEIRYQDASQRHEQAIKEGEDIDQESGLFHLAHKICSDLFRLWFKIMEYKLKESEDKLKSIENNKEKKHD